MGRKRAGKPEMERGIRFRSRVRWALLVLFFLPMTGLGSRPFLSWPPPINLSEDAGCSTFPTLVTLGGGDDLLVVWVGYNPDLGEVWARAFRQGVWEAPMNLSASEDRDEGAALYADGQGRAYVVWTRRNTLTGSDLLYRRWEGGNWSPPQVLDHTDTYLPSPYGLFFVANFSDTLCLFVTLGSGIRHTCLQGENWGPLTPWVYLPGLRRLGALIVGHDGLLHAAALGLNEDAPYGCDPWLDDAYYITSTNGITWSQPINLTYTGTIAYDLALAFDRDGALHFLWSDISPPCSIDSERSAIYERVLSGGIWSPRGEVSTPTEGQAQAVEDLDLVAGFGMLHLAWSEGVFDGNGRAVDLGIRYRRWADGRWEEEEAVWNSPDESINVSLTLLGGIVPALVWEEGPSTAEEVYFGRRGEVVRRFLPLGLNRGNP